MPFSMARSIQFSLLLISKCFFDSSSFFVTTMTIHRPHASHHQPSSTRTRVTRLHSTTKESSSSSVAPENRGAPSSFSKPLKKDNGTAKSLYDVLGTAPTASLDELKSKYKALARVQHPDVIGLQNGGSAGDSNSDAFIEIAAAYQLLKDPAKRRQYDRSLQAASFSHSISQFVNETNVVPNAVSLLEDIALPLFRKTTATTLAGMQAATQKSTTSKGGKNNNNSNNQGGGGTGNWWQRVIQAATTASRSMDVMELRDKAAVLEEEAVSEYEAAVALQQTIQDVVRQRLHFAVATPGSIITSDEAQLLDETVDVAPLQKVEADWQTILTADEVTNSELRTVTQIRIQAETAVLRAEQRKIEAQQAYERAIVEGRNKTMVLESAVAAEDSAKAAAQKSALAVDRQREIVTEQSERVRTALLAIVRPTVPPNATAVAELQSTEIELASAASQMELQAAKLLSRSNQMKQRALVLERMNTMAASQSHQQKR
jgi:curved DNA-binding protein CbpA